MLKYPDIDIVRFFFKNSLQKNSGNKIVQKVAELGCGCANNLRLFAEYGWQGQGVDIDKGLIENAWHNMKEFVEPISERFSFVCMDMVEYVKKYSLQDFDCVLLPSSLYYLSYDKINELLANMKIKDNVLFYIKMRTPKDSRCPIKYSKYTAVKIDYGYTGEKGCINTFFTGAQFRRLLNRYFSIKDLVVLKSEWENFMYGKIVLNSDFIMWARFSNRHK